MNRMPALFIGHGSPMNAIEDNEFSRGWAEAARRLPRPEAVLCISAHWETRGIRVTGATRPGTIHDFYGFPPALFQVRYPAPGHPALAERVSGLLPGESAGIDRERGLDHGCWSVLRAIYPDASVPVVQLSLDTTRPVSFHDALARRLRPLRDEGVLILGSGNMVHNLGLVDYDNPGAHDWAERCNDALKKMIFAAADGAAPPDYALIGPEALLAVPTPEHFLPLLYPLAVRDPDDDVAFFNDRVVLGSISMTCIAVGEGRGRRDDR